MAAGLFYYYMKQCEDGAHKTLSQEPVQAGCADVALVQSDVVCGVGGVSVPQTDSPVPSEDSPSEPEEKDRKAEASDLEDRVKELERLLCEAHIEYELKTMECERQWKDHSTLKSKYDQVTETLTHKEEALKNLQVFVANAEEKYELVINSCVLLESKNSKLILDMDELQESLQKTKDELCEAYRQCVMATTNLQATQNKIEQKYKQVMETNADLEKENSCLRSDSDTLQDCVHDLEKRLTRLQHKHNKLKMVSLADAEEKYELVIESFAQLQCDMMFQVNTLQASVQHLQKALRETGRKWAR